MSQVYATEPPTSGKVVMETTHGPLEIHLWCRECPLFTKFFLQLCVDGYFDSLPFHRILPNFLIQTGLRDEWNRNRNYKDYRASLQTSETLSRLQLETHGRISFHHRGQVAMAYAPDAGEEEAVDLEPQFFISLDEAPYLNGKHVIIGTIASTPTVFNALRIGNNTDTTQDGTPVDWDHAPRITSVRVSEDTLQELRLTPTPNVPWKKKNKAASTKDDERANKNKKKKRKGKRDLTVLSFGDDMEEEAGGGAAGIQSSHDVGAIQCKKKEIKVIDQDGTTNNDSTNRVVHDEEKGDAAEATPAESSIPQEEESKKNETETNRALRKEEPTLPPEPKEEKQHPKEESKTTTSEDEEEEEEERPKKKKKKQVISFVEARKLKYATKSAANDGSKKQRESDTMAKLLAFQNKVKVKHKKQKGGDDTSLASRMAKRAAAQQDNNGSIRRDGKDVGYHGQVLDDDDEDEDGGREWLATRFHCRQHMDHSAVGGDGRDKNDYLVVDDKKKKKRKRQTFSHKKHHYGP